MSLGTLSMGSIKALSSANAVSVALGGTFDLNGNSETIAGLNDGVSVGGVVTNSVASAKLLTLGGGGAYSYGGTITAATPADLALDRGLDRQRLADPVRRQYLHGATTITSGTLQIGNGSTGSMGSGNNYAAAIANSGAFLVDTGSSQTFSGAIFGSGAFQQLGTGITTLSGGGVAYTGPTTVSGGQLLLLSATNFKSAATVNSGAELALSGGTVISMASQMSVLLNSGGTLQNRNPSNWTEVEGIVTASGVTTISQSSNATTTGVPALSNGEGLYLDGGLQGSGTLTINAANYGSGVNIRSNGNLSTSFNGTLIVNGSASTAPFLGSGLGPAVAPRD